MIKKISTYQKLIKIKEENLEMAKNKLPVNVKKLRGTYRKSREAKNKPLTRGIPRKPSNMTPGAGRYWTMLINRLSKIGTLTTVDDLSIWILCESLNEYFEMIDYLSKNGRTYKFVSSKGESSERVRPECKILNDCWVRIYSLFRQYGLTHLSRNNLVPLMPETKNKWGRNNGK